MIATPAGAQGQSFTILVPTDFSDESSKRLYHAFRVTSAREVTKATKSDNGTFPRMAEMVALIDEAYSTDGFFASIKQVSWKAMCSYAHSGLLQVARRFSGDHVMPCYSEGEVCEVLEGTTTAIILLARMFFMTTNRRDEATKVEELLAEFSKA